MMSVHTNNQKEGDLDPVSIIVCVVYLSIWSGVGDFSVSVTREFNPLTHMVISSSEVAAEELRPCVSLFSHNYFVVCFLTQNKVIWEKYIVYREDYKALWGNMCLLTWQIPLIWLNSDINQAQLSFGTIARNVDLNPIYTKSYL